MWYNHTSVYSMFDTLLRKISWLAFFTVFSCFMSISVLKTEFFITMVGEFGILYCYILCIF